MTFLTAVLYVCAGMLVERYVASHIRSRIENPYRWSCPNCSMRIRTNDKAAREKIISVHAC